VTIDDRINLQKLQVFDCVVSLGGISRAADQLKVAQPVVTEHIQSLERRLGARLFEREGRRLVLTEAGRAAHEWCTDLLRRTREFDRELQGLADGLRGSIVIGTSMSTGSYELPTVEDRYRMIRAYFQMLLDEADASKELPRDGRMRPPADRSSSAGKETAGKMKQFATWFTHGVPGGAKLRAAIYQARTGADVLGQVEQFFAARREDGMDDGRDSAEELEAGGPEAFPDAALACG